MTLPIYGWPSATSPKRKSTRGVPILARCIREARTSNEAIGFDSLF